ncbi:MAG: hypothetical protein H6590_06225 [Flavobacteriales bacterium]|nr:hypothetical protein [Flavobacteriales bacterium]
MLSQLEAINRMLIALGSSPVNTIEGKVNRDVSSCKTLLDQARVSILITGWNFNTDKEVKLSPAADGRIQLAENALVVDLSPSVYQDTRVLDPVQRGRWLYNRVKQTYVWSRGLTVDIVRDLKWDELTEPARQYITAKAIEDAVTALEGDPQQIEKARLETMAARRNMMAAEISSSDLTIFDPETDYRIRNQHLRR